MNRRLCWPVGCEFVCESKTDLVPNEWPAIFARQFLHELKTDLTRTYPIGPEFFRELKPDFTPNQREIGVN